MIKRSILCVIDELIFTALGVEMESSFLVGAQSASCDDNLTPGKAAEIWTRCRIDAMEKSVNP
jgi:hypothetical protein